MNQLTQRPTAMLTQTMTLTRGSMARCSCQSRIWGPKTGWVISMLWNRGDERLKAKAATIRKGTVGTIGSTDPARARTMARIPIAPQRSRISSGNAPT